MSAGRLKGGILTATQDNPRPHHNQLQNSVRLVLSSPLAARVLGFIAFETAYYFAYRYGMSFGQTTAAPFWFPDSVLLCVLLASPPKTWWLFLLGSLPIRLFSEVASDVPSWFLLATFAIDSAKGLAAAIILRKLMTNSLRFETVRDLGIFGLVAVLLIPALSAFGGAAARSVLGDDFWSAWMQWFMGNALAELVVTPALLYWVFGATWNVRPPTIERLLEAGLLVTGLIVTGYVASNAENSSISFPDSRVYAPVPFLFFAAIRFGMIGATGAVAIIAVFEIEAALGGRGPFSGLSPNETALALQNFLLLRSAPLYFVATSIEQRKSVERSLQESEERFRIMANAAPVLLWMSGKDKLCTFFNQHWLAFTGRTIEEELGNGWAEGVHPDDLQRCLEIYHSAFDARQPFEMEYRLRRRDGEYCWILDAGVPRRAPNGDFIGYIGSAMDITDRKRAEDSTRALAHVQRLAVVGELTGVIAHELRQPLSAILHNADAAGRLLQSERPPLDEIREIVSDIRSADLRANDVLKNIQNVLRQQETPMRPLDINAAVSDVLLLVSGSAQQRHVQIRTDLHGRLPLVFGNRAQLQQVLINLIANGMDAMASTPEAACEMVIQTKPNGDGRVEVAVIDRGCGIAPEHMPRLFKSFFTTKKEGMGLGLSIARSIVQFHQGSIWADNNPEGGATVRFTVRIAEDQTTNPIME